MKEQASKQAGRQNGPRPKIEAASAAAEGEQGPVRPGAPVRFAARFHLRLSVACMAPPATGLLASASASSNFPASENLALEGRQRGTGEIGSILQSCDSGQ